VVEVMDGDGDTGERQAGLSSVRITGSSVGESSLVGGSHRVSIDSWSWPSNFAFTEYVRDLPVRIREQVRF
jgi:hypothetical protein